ncbi:MAG: ribonuclease PH [Alphaproteobacteria bacterium]|nr:ribonuclease PH [Alphaproteobacteria bacterium]MDY4689382.1 ribonuclease PH [Alphaproteobacteria bacterium]
MRKSNRGTEDLRQIEIIPNVNLYAEGSCLIKCGNTHVLCTASVSDEVPAWLKGSDKGWITAEYSLLPRATQTRVSRETKGVGGRTAEIQRLIGRSLRAAVDLSEMPEMCVQVDCDVLQADGGTRTASITGGFVALYLALQKMVQDGRLPRSPIREYVAAVSCGICRGEPLLDLDYDEDSHAGADTNFVLTESGKIVEIQATAEGAVFSESEFSELFRLAKQGIHQLIMAQKKAIKG